MTCLQARCVVARVGLLQTDLLLHSCSHMGTAVRCDACRVGLDTYSLKFRTRFNARVRSVACEEGTAAPGHLRPPRPHGGCATAPATPRHEGGAVCSDASSEQRAPPVSMSHCCQTDRSWRACSSRGYSANMHQPGARGVRAHTCVRARTRARTHTPTRVGPITDGQPPGAKPTAARPPAAT